MSKLLDFVNKNGNDLEKEPETSVKVERRIDGKTRALQIAAILCALFAAAGIAHGMHDADPSGGWATPAMAGVVAATALALVWHAMMGAIVGMVRTATIILLFIGAIIVTVIAVGASAQAIATAISGHSARAAELSSQIDAYGKALADAYTQATGWRGVADSAQVISVGFKAQSDSEAGGGNGTGKGCGPKCTSMMDASHAFGQGAIALKAMLDDAAVIRDKGDDAMGRMRTAAAADDQGGFAAAAEEVATQIGKLNAVDPKPIIDNTGMVIGSSKGIDVSKETAEFRAKASAALAERHAVEAPVFRPMSLGEATRRQIGGSALHGWILAGAIDILPLLFLAILFVMSREVWMHQEVERKKLTPVGRNERDRKVVDDMTEKAKVFKFPAAAE